MPCFQCSALTHRSQCTALTLGALTTHFSVWLHACTSQASTEGKTSQTEWKQQTWPNGVLQHVQLTHAQCSKSIPKPFLSFVERNHKHPDTLCSQWIGHSTLSLTRWPYMSANSSSARSLSFWCVVLIILMLPAAWEEKQQLQDTGFVLVSMTERVEVPSTKVKQCLPLLKECRSSTVLRIWLYTVRESSEKASDVKLLQTIPNSQSRSPFLTELFAGFFFKICRQKQCLCWTPKTLTWQYLEVSKLTGLCPQSYLLSFPF